MIWEEVLSVFYYTNHQKVITKWHHLQVWLLLEISWYRIDLFQLSENFPVRSFDAKRTLMLPEKLELLLQL